MSSGTDGERRANEDRLRIRWGWVLTPVVTGAALTLAALYAESRWEWDGVSQSILVTLRGALVFAGVLFLLERNFTGRAVSESSRRIREVEERMDARTEKVEMRLDDLQDATSDLIQRRHAEQDAALDTLSEDVSFTSVTRALDDAIRLNAISWGHVTVPGSPSADRMTVTFSWGQHEPSAWNEEPRLALEVEVGLEPDTSGASTPLVRVEWSKEESAPEVGSKLVQQLQGAGLWTGPESLDWGLALSNLHHVLRAAIASRRADPGARHFHEPLIQMVDEDWAITEAGIECPGHDFILKR